MTRWWHALPAETRAEADGYVLRGCRQAAVFASSSATTCPTSLGGVRSQ
ncbi:hypothetical protein ACIQU4_26710 [Streptomyces sp. NPDC090741]